MKSIVTSLLSPLFFVILSVSTNHAQFEMGIKAGISTFSVDGESLNILDVDSRENYGLVLKEGSYGYHIGLWTRIVISKFFIQPELVFNSNNVDYEFSNDSGQSVGQGVFSESYQELDIPILVGVDLGFLRLLGGPVGHVFLNSASDLLDFQDYNQNFDAMTIGYQLGLGIDIGRWALDVRWEDNFTDFGNHIRFFGEEYDFSARPQRILASIAYQL